MRLLLYRAFLNLLVQKLRRKEPVSEELQDLATVCIHVATEITTLTTDSIHAGVRSSGTLQGVLFHAMSYLWNALVTLLFFTRSRAAQDLLESKLRPIDIFQEIKNAATVFESHAEAVPFAQTVAYKIQTILERMEGDLSSKDVETGQARTAEATSSTISSSAEVEATSMPEVELEFPDFDATFTDFEEFFGAPVDPPFLPSYSHSDEN